MYSNALELTSFCINNNVYVNQIKTPSTKIQILSFRKKNLVYETNKKKITVNYFLYGMR